MDEDSAATFWNNIKQEIKRQNTTQDWIAKRAGISFNTFQGWISKDIFPRVNEAVRIADALGTSIEYLVRGSIHDNRTAIEVILRHLPQVRLHLDTVSDAVRALR